MQMDVIEATKLKPALIPNPIPIRKYTSPYTVEVHFKRGVFFAGRNRLQSSCPANDHAATPSFQQKWSFQKSLLPLLLPPRHNRCTFSQMMSSHFILIIKLLHHANVSGTGDGQTPILASGQFGQTVGLLIALLPRTGGKMQLKVLFCVVLDCFLMLL